MNKIDVAASPHALLIDDEPDQLRLLTIALRNISFRISMALDGEQGYARAVALQPDLILLDSHMPRGHGVTVARQLTANPATSHIPIIFLSAKIDPHDRLAGLRAGGVDYISKPFHIEEVLEKIRIHLELSRKQKRFHTEDEAGLVPGADRARDSAAISLLPADLLLRNVAKNLILTHIGEPITRLEIAAMMDVSVKRLDAVFEGCYGMSVFEFIRRERMRRAALMLGQSTLSITSIAVEVGYTSAANFATEFKKLWDMSPTQFRMEAQANPTALQQLMASKLG